MKWVSAKSAGVAYLLPGLGVLLNWHTLLFTVPGPGPWEGLRHVLFEASERAMYWWIAALPVACLSMAAAYWSPLAKTRSAVLAMAAIGVALAIVAWLTMHWETATFVTLPLIFSVPLAKRHLAHRSSDGEPA